MKAARLTLLACFFLFCSCRHIMPEWTTKVPGILADAKESIFMIMVKTSDGKAFGNSFMVEQGVLLTAKHVCHGDVGSMLNIMKDKKMYTGYIAWKDAVADVCVIETDAPGKPLTLLADVADYNTGYVVCYVPHGVGPPQIKLAIRELQIRNEQPLNDDEGRHLIINGQFQHGDSGAPVLNEDGYVIGILTGIFANRESDMVGNGIAVAVDPLTVFNVYQDYLKARKDFVPDPLKLNPPAGTEGKIVPKPSLSHSAEKTPPKSNSSNNLNSDTAPQLLPIIPPKMILVPLESK